jgi:hypothetical protein
VNDSADAIAHYLWPPCWIGTEPEGEPFGPIRAADLGEVVFDADLIEGMRLRAFRDGMLAFDLASWGDKPPGRLSEAKAEVEYQTRCVRLMNVHLACLYVATLGALPATVLAPSRLMSVTFSDGLFMGGSGDPISLELFLARKAGVLEHGDWRGRRNLQPVWIEALQESVDRLKQLLSRGRQDVTLLRADMLYRSVAAFQVFDYSAALVNAWTTIEGLLGDKLDAYLTDLDENREVGDGETFVSSERFRFYRGSQVTSKLTAEILSLADRLEFPLYRSILKSAQARNRWLHSQQPSERAADDAKEAIFTATKLFALTEGVELPMHLSTPLHRV